MLTIRHNFLIEELPAVISIDAQDRERKERSRTLEDCQHGLPTAVEEREAFSPACCNVRQGEGVQVPSLCFSTAMGDQICFQKARQRFIPALEGADRDLVFEERSCLGSGYPAKTVLSLGTQKPICCRCTHREQLVPALLAEVEMSMPLVFRQIIESGANRAADVQTDQHQRANAESPNNSAA